MKPIEISLTRKFSTPLEFFDWFKKENSLVEIGCGAFAKAFSSKGQDDVVYKVGVVGVEIDDDYSPPDGEWQWRYYEPKWEDDPYLAFLEDVALKYQGNPFVPVVHYVKYVTVTHPTTGVVFLAYVVAMERLRTYHHVQPYKRKRTLKLLNDMGFTAQCEDDDMDTGDIGVWLSIPLEFAKRNKTFRPIARPLDTLFNEFNEDLHDGNVMFRKIGHGLYHPVITDPVS